LEDQWARQALNGAGRAHCDAEQDFINRNNSDQRGHLVEKNQDETQWVGLML